MRERVNNPKWEEGIFLIDRDGTHEQRIGEGRWPDWSPDGKEIVFSLGGEQTGGARSGATICIAKADGTGRREITDGDCPSWSPDGKKIAFCFRGPDAPPLIRVYELHNKKQETLGIGWFRANWMADNFSVITNGLIGEKIGMVRMSMDAPFQPTELSTEYDDPVSPAAPGMESRSSTSPRNQSLHPAESNSLDRHLPSSRQDPQQLRPPVS